MAGPKDKRKKIKRISRTDKDGNKIYVGDSPSNTRTRKTYKKSGTKSGVEEYSKIDKTGKGKGYSVRSVTRDVKPNKRVEENQYVRFPRTKQVITSSTQAGNYESDYQIVDNKKSGAGYSGDSKTSATPKRKPKKQGMSEKGRGRSAKPSNIVTDKRGKAVRDKRGKAVTFGGANKGGKKSREGR